ncbi:hypothetical protein [uncultured Clostridium sp.]|uniref:hypothetical protein n=1 Tax=uncultured Clostridium sp. TaxID=59620 RepID=UPI0028E19C47|nr:hypothetical protein [uncultured Clostridium sp.]
MTNLNKEDLAILTAIWQEKVLRSDGEGDIISKKLRALVPESDEDGIILSDIINGVYGEEAKRLVLELAHRNRKHNTNVKQKKS